MIKVTMDVDGAVYEYSFDDTPGFIQDWVPDHISEVVKKTLEDILLPPVTMSLVQAPVPGAPDPEVTDE